MSRPRGHLGEGHRRRIHLPRCAHRELDLAERRVRSRGTAVTVTGTDFTKASEVNFGSKAGTEVEFKSSTELVVQSPEATGAVHVTVKTAGGTSTTGTADQFTYRGEPTVSSVSPNEGPTSGATKVTIIGTNLDEHERSQVRLHAAPAKSNSRSAGELIAKSPAGSGTVHVTVKTAGGSSTAGTDDQFTYRLLPSVSSVSPNEGPEAGGTSVKITGRTSRARAK